MRILRLSADNFMRLVCVEITPDGNIVRVTGKNGSGKTSCLNAIVAALGGSKSVPDKPIREGEGQARVVVETEEYTVTRRFTAGRSTLEIKNAAGSTIGSPQALLDKIVGSIAFDPLAFSQMKDKDQRETLLRVLNLNLDEHDAKIERLRNQRKEMLADKKRADDDASRLPQYPGAGTDEVSVADLSVQLREAHAVNGKARDMERRFSECQQLITAHRAKIKDLEEAIDKLNAECREIEGQCQSIDVIDTQALEEQIANAEEINRHVRLNRQRREALARSEELAATIKAKYEEIQQAEADKSNAISSARMPVAGLGIDANGLTLDGIPFRQVNHAKRLEVSLAVAMAMNPELRVMIVNGNGLDKASLETIAGLAEEKDYQVWMEVATDGEKGVGIVIEDGSVVE